MSRRTFKDKVVVVTGAAGGLGRELCRRFAQAGARLAGIDVDDAGLRELSHEIQLAKVQFESSRCDLTDFTAVERSIQKIRDAYDGIDVLINNAGISHRSAFAQTDVAVIRKVMKVNFFGAVNCTRAALQLLRERRGMIIVISSVAGFSPLIARTGYAASKYALHGFFESLRTELRAEGVAVMMVCPSFIDTGIVHKALGGDGNLAEHAQVIIGKRMQPAQAADRIFKAACKEKRLVLVGGPARLAYWAHKLLPSFYERVMARRLRGEM